jgi:hypothetical protein
VPFLSQNMSLLSQSLKTNIEFSQKERRERETERERERGGETDREREAERGRERWHHFISIHCERV